MCAPKREIDRALIAMAVAQVRLLAAIPFGHIERLLVIAHDMMKHADRIAVGHEAEARALILQALDEAVASDTLNEAEVLRLCDAMPLPARMAL